MKIVETVKEKVISCRTEIFIADDGTEFENKYACIEYERGKHLKSVEHLKIEEMTDWYPINCEDCREDHSFTWYKVNNEEEFDLLNVAYEDALSRPKVYPETICVEEDYDHDTWDYCLSDMFKRTESFWSRLGYAVSFEKGEQ